MKRIKLSKLISFGLASLIIFSMFQPMTTFAATECSHQVVEKFPGTPPTCGNSGLTEGVKCTACGEILTAQQIIPATGNHVPEKISGVPATCGASGLTEGAKCKNCNKVLAEQQTIPATGNHVHEIISGIPATCGVSGLTEGAKCKNCNKVLVEQQTIPATGEHTIQIVPAVPGDCKNVGLTEGKVCSVCNEVLEAQISTELGNHIYESGKCTICGYKKPSSNKPSSSKPSNSEPVKLNPNDADFDDVPKTGDISTQMVCVFGGLFSFVVLCLTVVYAKRKMVK